MDPLILELCQRIAAVEAKIGIILWLLGGAFTGIFTWFGVITKLLMKGGNKR